MGEDYYRKETEFNLKSLKTAEPRPTWGGAGGVCEDLLGVTVWLCLALEWNESADGGEGFQLPRACGVKGIASEFYLNWEKPKLGLPWSILPLFDLRVRAREISSVFFLTMSVHLFQNIASLSCLVTPKTSVCFTTSCLTESVLVFAWAAILFEMFQVITYMKCLQLDCTTFASKLIWPR